VWVGRRGSSRCEQGAVNRGIGLGGLDGEVSVVRCEQGGVNRHVLDAQHMHLRPPGRGVCGRGGADSDPQIIEVVVEGVLASACIYIYIYIYIYI